jgi:hypothetical protein
MFRGRFRGRAKSTARFTNTKIGAGLAVLAKYGSSAHLWLPGVGSINGIQAQNYLDSAGTTPASVDNPVGLVKDAILSGAINASQATTANKPTLRRGLVNLLTYSNDLTSAAWGRPGISVTSGVSDPYGGSTAQASVEDATTGAHSVYQVPTNTASVFTIAAIIKNSQGSRYTYVRAVQGGGLHYTGVILDSGLAYQGSYTVGTNVALTGYDIAPLDGGFALVVLRVALTAAASCGMQIDRLNGPSAASNASYTGDGSSALTVYRSAAFQGTITAAQILQCGGIPLTTTAAASSSAGNWGWETDGAAKTLTASVAPTTVLTVVWAGVLTSLAGNQIVGQPSGGFQIYVNSDGLVGAGYSGQAGACRSAVGALAAGQPYVITFTVTIGGTATLRINGVTVATSSAMVTPFNQSVVGLMSNGAAGYFQAGRMSGASIVLGAPSLADLLAIERMIGALTGPTGVQF